MNSLVIPTLDTGRLRLRPFRLSDFEDYATMCGDPGLATTQPKGMPFDADVSWRHMAFIVGHWQLLGAGMWAVEEKETGAFVGRIGFCEPHGWPGFELAWTVVRSRWRRGYATEGARAALAYAFNHLRKDQVISLIAPDNLPSIRVAEHIGERLQRQLVHLEREFLVYGIDRESFLRSQRGEETWRRAAEAA